MNFSEKHQQKLQRYREWEEEKQRRKQLRHKKRVQKSINRRGLKIKARHRSRRAELMRIQNFVCAICKRTGARKMVADSFKNKIVRGVLCPTCNHMLTRFKDDPNAILAHKDSPRNRIPDRIINAAVRYLNNWPSSRLPYFIQSRNTLNEMESNDNSVTLIDTTN